jgi:formate hydrogenlyase transcriptional activator
MQRPMSDHAQLYGRVTPDTSGTALSTDDRVRFEALLAELSARFVNLRAQDVDAAIQTAQRRIVEELGIDRSVLYVADGHAVFRCTHFWSALERSLPPPQIVSTGYFPWMSAKVFGGETVSYTSVDELPSPDRESARQFGTKSSIVVPLSVGGRVMGALTFSVLREERHWPPQLVPRLRLIAEVFANALARKSADEELRLAVAEVERLRDRLRNENEYLRREVTTLQGPMLIVGASKALQHALDQASQVAPTAATVLLIGETGTGKELFASQIHDLSPRRNCLMVRVNCSAIPSALIESELFGREKGAYTGALSRQAGRFEVADKSTLLLDEIGDLPLEIQIKLLRVLQERQIERLGSSTPINVDLRIVAATNRDLEQAIAQGTFREELYYRLNVFPIHIPPLRERPDDIPMLVWAFVDEFSKALGKPIESVSKESMLALQRYHWPGNVRELRNVVERAVIIATGPRLTIELPKAAPSAAPRHGSIALADIERDHIVAVLERVKWRVRGDGGAAKLLGMKPSTLESRMAKLGIQRPRS